MNTKPTSQKLPMSFGSQSMPHKSIDLINTSQKKSSMQNSQQQQQQQQFEKNLTQNTGIVGVKSSSETSPVLIGNAKINNNYSNTDTSAGSLQKLFLEQKKLQSQDESSPGGINRCFKEKSPSSMLSSGGCGEFENTSNGNNQNVSKQLTQETVGGVDASRRFSMFSKSSFATQSSFLFGTRILNKSAMAAASKSTPKVNISSIFKNKAYLYLDEALISTFDDLLDKGHSIVTQRKEERDILVSMEVTMKHEAQELEKEIIPLIQRANICNEQISHQNGLQQQYENEISGLVQDLTGLRGQIYSREKEIAEAHSDLTNAIKQMEINNNEIRSDIHINKACHRQEANQQAIHKKQKQAEMDELTKQLIALKAEYEQKKLAQADRLRKMENKQKMYMGILKH